MIIDPQKIVWVPGHPGYFACNTKDQFGLPDNGDGSTARRMQLIGMLASSVAHDLSSVLAPILIAVQSLEGDLRDASSCRALDLIRQSVERGRRLVDEIVGCAIGEPIALSALSPHTELDGFVRFLELVLPPTIQLGLEIDDEPWQVLGNSTQLNQVLMNLVLNARDAMPAGGFLTLSAKNIHLAATSSPQEAGFVCLAVSDSGTGIPPEIRERIFEPFFTTKAGNGGTGLGLASSLAIVRSHRGFIGFETEVGVGTRFNVYLPAFGTKHSNNRNS